MQRMPADYSSLNAFHHCTWQWHNDASGHAGKEPISFEEAAEWWEW